MKSSGFPYSIAVIIAFVITGLIVGNSFIVYNAGADETITIATLEYAPWTGKNLKKNGFVNHVITEALQRKAHTVRYAYLPWKRAVTDTKSGRYSALSYVYWSKDREKEFYLSDPISEEKIVFFHLKSNPIKDWESLEDLKDYRVGATRGYTYTKAFWDAAKSRRLMVDVTNTDLQNFQKLLSGRIDIFPSSVVNGSSILENAFDTDKTHLLSFHPKPLSNPTGHLAFAKSNKNSENLLRMFNQGLAQLKNEGLYDKFKDDLLADKYSQ